MFWWRFLLLIFSWLLILVSERVIPATHSALTLANDWWTLLFFKPFHVMVAMISFLSALLLIRYLILEEMGLLFTRGKNFFLKRMGGFILLALSCGVLIHSLFKHLLPTIFVMGAVLLYDISQVTLRGRRNRRLRAAFRGRTKDF